jgi:hypothetical protein
MTRVTHIVLGRLFGGVRVQRLLLLFALGSALALLAAVPSFTPLPGIDSGIFLYAARAIVHGAVPYRDLWDNEPLGIFLIDALGLCIGDGSRWGVWALEWISLWTAAMVGFKVLRTAFGEVPALFAIACWLPAVALSFQGGNFTEEFVLPLQFASLVLFQRISIAPIRLIDAILVGILGALAFELKPNAIGVWLAISIWSVGHFWSRRMLAPLFKLAAGGIVGALVVWLPLVVWLYRNGALAPFWDQAFRYNFIYSENATWVDRAHCIYAHFRFMTPAGLSLLVLPGWVLAIYLRALHPDLLRVTAAHLLSLATVAFPLETALVSTTPDIYFHHFLVPLATWTILLAFVAWVALSGRTLVSQGLHLPVLRGPIVTLCALTLVAWRAGALATWHTLRTPDDQRQIVLQYILLNSNRGDNVLTWGLSAALDFAAARREPSRYYHEFPLSTHGYVTPHQLDLFKSDLEQHKPALIIDSSVQSGRLPPMDANDRNLWIAESSAQWRAQLAVMMLPIFRYVQENYRVSAKLGPERWVVYRRIH